MSKDVRGSLELELTILRFLDAVVLHYQVLQSAYIQ
jgi:hypothetical protein